MKPIRYEDLIKQLGISMSTARRMVAAGQLCTPLTISKRIRVFPADTVEIYLKGLQQTVQK